MADLDSYELRGVVIPGAALVAGIALLYPAIPLLTMGPEFTVGELGAFVILSFVAGHVVAAVANILETRYWALQGGMPTMQAKKTDSKLLSGQLRGRVRVALSEHLGITIDDIATKSDDEWKGLVRSMYAHIDAKGRTKRMEAFNSNYGLFRGLTTSFLLLVPITLVKNGLSAWPVVLALLLIAILCAARMQRFSKYYATELFAQFAQKD